MINYECVDGVWTMKDTKGVDLDVPGDDGEMENIPSLGVGEGQKALGLHDCPAGGSEKQLEAIKEKVRTWTKKMKNRHLPPCLSWMAYRLKLWPSVRFGIGTMTNDLEAIANFLDKEEYETMNSLRVASTIKKGWRRLHSTFGGVGLFNFAMEQLIERLGLLLQHYRTGSCTSKKMDTSVAHLQLQLGTSTCPLDLDYNRWAFLVPLSWIKMLWHRWCHHHDKTSLG